MELPTMNSDQLKGNWKQFVASSCCSTANKHSTVVNLRAEEGEHKEL
jgi:hypothetical protein